MKLIRVFLWFTAVLLGSAVAVPAQDEDANAERFAILIQKINEEFAAGKNSPADLAADLKQFDVLLAAEKGRHTDLAAAILMQKGMLYYEALADPDSAKAIFQDIKTNYPATRAAANIDALLDGIDHESQMKKIRTLLAPGTYFPDFLVTNAESTSLSVKKYQGKVVLIDFWATWCPLCIESMPDVTATYAKYHDQGFEIIGISLDDSPDKLPDFTKPRQMTWPQYCDGKGWDGWLVAKYGVTAIPDNILVDGKGNIIARKLTGDALPQAVAKALGK